MSLNILKAFLKEAIPSLSSLPSKLLDNWPSWLLLFSPIVIAFILGIIRHNRLRRAGMPEIDKMDGEQFERKLALLFQQKGYKVERTPYQGDWGAGLIVSQDGRRTAIQAKRWNRKVNPKAVQEIVSAKAKYGCQAAMVVTNSYFTQAATELARANGVELWNRQRLTKELRGVQKRGEKSNVPLEIPRSSTKGQDEVVALAETAAAVEVEIHSNPTCSKCGQEMVLKVGRYGPFWACTGFPECRNTLPAKGVEGNARQSSSNIENVSALGSRRDLKRR